MFYFVSKSLIAWRTLLVPNSVVVRREFQKKLMTVYSWTELLDCRRLTFKDCNLSPLRKGNKMKHLQRMAGTLIQAWNNTNWLLIIMDHKLGTQKNFILRTRNRNNKYLWKRDLFRTYRPFLWRRFDGYFFNSRVSFIC